jgi:hypothetical protein
MKNKKNGFQKKQSKTDKNFHLKNEVFDNSTIIEINSESSINFVVESMFTIMKKLIEYDSNVAVASYHKELLKFDTPIKKQKEHLYIVPATTYIINDILEDNISDKISDVVMQHFYEVYDSNTEVNDIYFEIIIKVEKDDKILSINMNNGDIIEFTFSEILLNNNAA